MINSGKDRKLLKYFQHYLEFELNQVFKLFKFEDEKTGTLLTYQFVRTGTRLCTNPINFL